MMESQKTKFFTFWAITILLFSLYLLDRSQVKNRINKYKLDIALIEKELIDNEVLIDKINDSRNQYESIMDTIKSYNISGGQLMSEISRVKLMASKLNIQLYKVEIDPKNTFPEELGQNSTINLELERQTLKFNLRGNFLDLGKFLENYEKINSPLRIQSCMISLDSLDPKGVIAQLHFATYTGLES
tara:strand:+ start:209 stop:769 length:561 start_codon:yes stop_codon:yes gene_type:complete